jgi:pyruvate,water dikinase
VVGKAVQVVTTWIRETALKLGLSGSRRPGSPRNVDELRLAFQHRYHHFKLLLSANNRALEIMSEMEEMLRGTRPFGMTFVRSRCTRVSTHVFQIIQHLDALAPGKYTELYERFRHIQRQINPFVHGDRPRREGPLVVPLDRVDKESADLVGSKMAALGELSQRLGVATPRGFAVTAFGTARFLEHDDLQTEIERRLQAARPERLDELFALSAQIQQLIIQAPVPPELEQAVGEHIRRLEEQRGGPLRFAVRSSSLVEDLPGMSFAGQFRSELNVSSENALQAFKEVVASKYGLAAMTYRLHHGLRDQDVAMCVGFLEMVDAVAGGVVYTRHPVRPDEEVLVINAVWGLPKSVVDGSVTPDAVWVSRREPHPVLKRTVGRKSVKYVCDPDEGVCRLEAVGEEADRVCLSDEQAAALARLALRIEAHYGAAQDIEWALDPSGRVMVLQARPFGTQRAAVSETLQGEDSGAVGEASPPQKVLLGGGVTASPGAASGPVFLVRRDADALAFPEGAVLVVGQALPRWATLLGRAAAVVSEQGSVAGHLANVAREFGVPALFDVPEACSRLEPGRVVTVDADRRRIYAGKTDLPSSAPSPRPALMKGTPVHAALEGACRHIVPLHLLDPDSPRFSPRHCTTFHDITRFCHEKAVAEMFRFGSEHDFPERAAKQLRCRVPMQFWIIDLDDGFIGDIPGPYVTLDRIASIPMRALWEGMTAVPWEGPPPVDTRGFMSVLMEATANPALDPAVASPYAVRNYFMISRHFCSLQSRFGFHFSTVEALVSDRTSENYASFQFKGGAADLRRRILRARFVADLLEVFDFRCEVREDAAFARVEGRSLPEMEDRLRILGHLIIHTRQLDMVMDNAASVVHHKRKMLEEIEGMLRRGTTEPSGEEAAS